jgi:lysophospholipase L1-like esterase
MRRLAFALACMAAAMGGSAAGPESCDTPGSLTYTDGQLRAVAAAVKNDRRLEVLVEGTGSSALAGNQGAGNSYPARLEAKLAKRLPGVEVKVRTDIKSRRTAAEMNQLLGKLALDGKPNLVIWQTGTVDAMRSVDPEEFRSTLESGVVALHAAGVDVILVNMQYSPRTETMVSVGPYADAMRWVAQQHDVPLFDRLSIMKHWSESGTFDLTGPDKTQVAERVHDCVGLLLANMIVEAAKLPPSNPTKETR